MVHGKGMAKEVKEKMGSKLVACYKAWGGWVGRGRWCGGLSYWDQKCLT